MLFLFFTKIFSVDFGPMPKLIELENRKNTFITSFSNGILLVKRTEEPTNINDPSVVQLIKEDPSGFIIKFGSNKYLCSHPKKNHIGICNTSSIKNTKWKIDKLKDSYLIKQNGKCLTAIIKSGAKKRKYRLKLQECSKNHKWKIENVPPPIDSDGNTIDDDCGFDLQNDKNDVTIIDELKEANDLAKQADVKYKSLRTEILKEPLYDGTESNINKPSSPFTYFDDNEFDKLVKIDHSTGLVYNDNVKCPQPDYSFRLGGNFYNVYDFLDQKVPLSTIPIGKAKDPCSANKILKKRPKK
ncbi:hypothetical protein M153_8800018433 [Pseudoloma neurophilia]|uniref:Uncharacterized protein n=1 Tax=Pseudoloma neurophilia TaxID=146866 RepID=A0A0R0M5U1_9MICR|nr:hypothetical protein M153_8800018433 [Pseudoloma neurophilia]